MTLSPAVVLLRRYVLERASERFPCKEFARYDFNIGAWVRCDEATARASEHWRRLRRSSAAWCPVLGSRTDVLTDDALQAFFLTISEDEWQRLATRVGKRPKACLRDWREAGRRILSAVSNDHPESGASPGKLAGWPTARGTGRRGLQAC
ncbi:hypothetical protein FLL57_20355 [Rhodopseudomonas palustris]|nr:hypothetical protein FLL57_20355 [Rhodopseudomonas palustris]